MVEPLVRWDPSLLRQIGFVLALLGASALLTYPLERAGFPRRGRVAIAATMGLSGYYSLDQYPWVREVATLLAVTLAVVVPVVLCTRVVRDLLEF